MNFNEITSVNNEIIKDIAKLHLKKYRKEAKTVILEGEKSVFGAFDDGLNLKSIFVLDGEKYVDFIKKTGGQAYLVNEKVMAKISSTTSIPTILALCDEPKYDLAQFKKMKKIALLDGIKDAGNLGTIIRSAIAFGIEGILLFGECVDEFSSKVIRSSAGNIFKIPIVHLGMDTSAIKNFENSHKMIMTVVGPEVKNAAEVDYNHPFILMLGSEAHGLCNELLNMGGEKVTLRMENKVESLNLSVFAGIMFYIINHSK